jgi:TonB family protein
MLKAVSIHRIGAVKCLFAPRLAASLAVFIASSAQCADIAHTANEACACKSAEAAASAPALWVVEGPFEPDPARTSCDSSYPEAARRAGAIGRTVLEYVINPNGVVQRIAVLESSGVTREHRMLDRAAIKNIATCPMLVDPEHPLSQPQTFKLTFNWILD